MLRVGSIQTVYVAPGHGLHINCIKRDVNEFSSSTKC